MRETGVVQYVTMLLLTNVMLMLEAVLTLVEPGVNIQRGISICPIYRHNYRVQGVELSSWIHLYLCNTAHHLKAFRARCQNLIPLGNREERQQCTMKLTQWHDWVEESRAAMGNYISWKYLKKTPEERIAEIIIIDRNSCVMGQEVILRRKTLNKGKAIWQIERKCTNRKGT